MALMRRKNNGEPGGENPADIVKSFENELKAFEDVLYGVTLFFGGIELLYAGQEAVIETHRKQLRNIITAGRSVSQRATALLEEAKQDPRKAGVLREFDFTYCHGHPDPHNLRRRAEALVAAHQRLFPDRPRSQPLTEEETLRLVEEASRATEKLA